MDNLPNDVVGVLVHHCHSWKDLLQLSLSCQTLYSQVRNSRFSVPWEISTNDRKSRALPQEIATTLTTRDLSQEGVDYLSLVLDQFSAMSTIDISICPVLSFKKAKALVGVLMTHDKSICIRVLKKHYDMVRSAKDRQAGKVQAAHNLSITILKVEQSSKVAESSKVKEPSEAEHTSEVERTPEVEEPSEVEHTSEVERTPEVEHTLEDDQTEALTITPTSHQNHNVNLDEYETPEWINETKQRMKRLAVVGKVAHPRREAKRRKIEQLVPFPTHRLLSSKNPYRQDESRADDDSLLGPVTMHTVESVTTAIQKYGTRFIESLLIFGDYWIFTTAVDGFFHHTHHIDDAADSSPLHYYEMATAVIKEKTMYGNKFYEASIHIGYLELLLVGGFVGSITDLTCTAFLGSSIGDLPAALKKTTTADLLLTPATCRPSSSTFRSIRQHAKFSADREWSFISTYYAEKGYYPVTAMNYCTHVNHRNKSTAITYSLASFSIQCIARGTARQDDINAMLHLVLQDQRVQKMIKLDLSIVTSFKGLAESIATQANEASAYFIKNIALLVTLEEKALLNDSNRNLIAFMPQLKSDVITLLNDGFAIGIKTANANVIGTFHKAYPKFFN